MVRFLVFRLSQMVLSLLGVSLAAILLLELLPGDVALTQMAERRSGYSASDLEKVRRTFSLHLPLLFNSSPEDADDANRRMLRDLAGSTADRAAALRTLTERGTLALHAVLPILRAADPASRLELLRALEPVAARRGRLEALHAAADPVAFWTDEGAAVPSSPDEARAQALQAVKGLLNGTDPTAATTLARLDTFALPTLFSALETDMPMDQVVRLGRVLAGITALEMPLAIGTTEEQAISLWVEDWRDWWRSRRADFVTLEGTTRVLAHVTQTRYAQWVSRLIALDFGRSSYDRRPIREKLGERLNVTLTLSLMSLFLAYLVAIPLGVFSAVKFYSLSDRIVTLCLFVMYSVPSFWLAMLMQQFLCGVDPRGFNLFPLLGLGVQDYTLSQWLSQETAWVLLWHLVLPVTILSYRSFAYLSRYQRSAMLEVVRQDYIRTARAKGLRERTVIFRHALGNSLLPLITLLGMQLPSLVGGAVIVEMVFQLNGMGLATLEAILYRDVNWIMAAVSIISILTMVGNFLADVTCALADPRIRLEASNRPAA